MIKDVSCTTFSDVEVEGFFSMTSKCLVDHILIKNKLIGTSIQSGCADNLSDFTKQAKQALQV